MFDVLTRDPVNRDDPRSLLDAAFERLERADRRVAVAQAERYAAMLHIATMASDHPDHLDEFASQEIAAALKLTRRSADAEVELAWKMCVQFPAVWQALADGRIDVPRARVIVDEVAPLDLDAAGEIVSDVLESARERTTGQLRARVKRRVQKADPESAKTRYEQGVAERRVTLQANHDGTADLTAHNLPADRAHAAMRRIIALAKQAKVGGDRRTADQVRADVLVDLLDGSSVIDSSGRPRRAGVDIQVDLSTLAGLDDNPGELRGFGPVIADVARRVVDEQVDAEWRVTVTDPETNDVVWVGTQRRRPTAAMRRAVHARRPTCVAVGCRMPAADSDIDHHETWAETGRTHPDHLGPLCRFHHRMRHEGGWTVRRRPDDVYEWTSKLGRAYTVDPRGP